jgi:hypothetical protein
MQTKGVQRLGGERLEVARPCFEIEMDMAQKHGPGEALAMLTWAK